MSDPIKTRVTDAMKSAMKAGDKATVTFARSLHAAIRKKEIDTKTDLDDSGVIQIITSAVKQRQESIEQFKKGGRDDLVQSEEAELAFLRQYLPPQLTEAELSGLVQTAIDETGAASPKEMGKVMQVLLPKVQGRADGKLVSQMVREKLS